MLFGLQTHFDGLLSKEDMKLVKSLGFQLVRMEISPDQPIDLAVQMLNQAEEFGLRPLLIIQSSLEQLNNLPYGTWVEWSNEPDLAVGRPAPIPPVEYKTSLEKASIIAETRGIVLWAPVISNLNKRGFDYLKAILPLPPNVKVSVHRYGDGTFEAPHKLNKWWPFGRFHSRDEEIEYLKSLVGNREIGVSEFGYPSLDDISEEDQADRIKKEWRLFEKHNLTFASLYQINDGPSNLGIDHFGIRRADGTLKPSAFTIVDTPIPVDEGEDEDMAEKALLGVDRNDLINLPNGKVAVRWPSGSNTVLSIQPNGDWETRPDTAIGPWEEAELKGSKLKYKVEGFTYFVVVD